MLEVLTALKKKKLEQILRILKRGTPSREIKDDVAIEE